MIKKREVVSDADINKLVSDMADKNYGIEKKETSVVTSISLPESMLIMLEDLALENKRAGIHPKNVSSIIRASVELYVRS